MNKPEAERAVVKMLNGTSSIIIIATKDDNSIYPRVLLGNNNYAEFVKLSTMDVPYYEEVKKKGLFN
jgi:hypothetical protein